MPALYIMIPAALLLVGVAVYIFFWAVDSGQYDDLESPAHSILFDDQDPRHQAAVKAPPTDVPPSHEQPEEQPPRA
ncbi:MULTISPECIES: cbb3-type cytochrome oxidase assembly protein CcoS [Pseudomonas]|uniref:cbb3-type cytochrome oxidase assembly protein CcoS n=1 Tax=Pseudomonas TaxID=286 RepID=UPI0003F9592F|nr:MULTISPECIES: cbb3-type cytochrome oxidase assembly protein CcoS [Pseudomonas]